ncbi:unnamed protein product [Symbiodinium microadriaticum]|nr:unnamed protein product [Symbiodinium microadriaticum]
MAPVPMKPAVSRRYPPAPGRSRRFSCGSECTSEDGVTSVASTTLPDSESELDSDCPKVRTRAHTTSDCSWTINVLPPTELQSDEVGKTTSLSGLMAGRDKLRHARARCHGPALWWSSQEERMERTPKDLDSLQGTGSEELSSILDCKIFDDVPDESSAYLGNRSFLQDSPAPSPRSACSC